MGVFEHAKAFVDQVYLHDVLAVAQFGTEQFCETVVSCEMQVALPLMF